MVCHGGLCYGKPGLNFNMDPFLGIIFGDPTMSMLGVFSLLFFPNIGLCNLDKHAAQVLRGRLALSYPQIFGVSGKAALQKYPLTPSGCLLFGKLKFLRRKLGESKPRRVSVCALDTAVVLTDACFASDSFGGLGGCPG